MFVAVDPKINAHIDHEFLPGSRSEKKDPVWSESFSSFYLFAWI